MILRQDFSVLLGKPNKKLRKKTGGQGRKAVLNEAVNIHVFQDEICSPVDLLAIEQKKHNDRLNVLYGELQSKQQQLNKLQTKSTEYETQIKMFQEANTALNTYIDNFQGEILNKGKEIAECKSKKYAIKKVGVLKERVNKALWFAKSFGVKFTEIKVEDSAGCSYDLVDKPKPVSRYDQLPETEKCKVKSLLYVLDALGISDDAYHELSLQNDGLARSYLIKQCRDDINKICNITQTPGNSTGAQMCLHETLERLLGQHVNSSEECPIIQLKFAADGAKMSRVSNFLVLSLAILNSGEEVMSMHGQHTLAIVDAKENFISIKESFQDIFTDINKLLSQKDTNGFIPYKVNGKEYLLEIFLGGDMKFLLTMLGMNAANAKYACIYCKVEKSSRHDMSKGELFYCQHEMKKTIDEMVKLCTKKVSNYGSVHPPLLNVDLDHIVVDELHLMMRIVDVLLRNLIENAVNLDQKESLGKTSKTKRHFDEVVNIIRDCGVSFSIWENRIKDGKGDSLKNLDWTSPTGTDMKKILKHLPAKLLQADCVPSSARLQLSQLWEDFHTLYNVMNMWSPSSEQVENFFHSAKTWDTNFTELRSCLEGFDFKNVTPYMHILVYHIPMFLKKYKGIKQFTGQGVEKCNDDIKMIYHRKSNRHDPTAESLRVRFRKSYMIRNNRIKRKYRKLNNNFWSNGGKRQIFQNFKLKCISSKPR